MRKTLLTGLAAAALISFSGPAAYSQSPYFQAVTNLNPILYLPLQETVQPPIADVETNLGSLGASANAIYSGHNITKAQTGATGDGDFSVLDTDAWGGFLAVPTTDPRTGVQSPSFTVECWVNPAEIGRNFEGIVAKSGGTAGGTNNSNNQGGWCLSENYISYLDSANMIGFDFHVFNGSGHGGAEAVVPFNVQINTWYHLVAVYDGTNAWLYINGTNETASGVGYQIPMTGSYLPDTWNQLQIGSSRNLNGNNYHGNIDEVAIYTNALSSAQVATHYGAASGTGYATTVLADSPYMYWRMDSPGYTAPDPSTYPTATNYGTLPSSFWGIYGTATQPGVTGPQYSGMLDPNNGNASYGVAINGIGGNNGNTANVPVGYNTSGVLQTSADGSPIIITNVSFTDPNAALLNPTNGTGRRIPFSVTIWFKANPHDWARFQTLFGHSDSGWRMSMNNSGVIQWNPGPGGEVATPYVYDNGSWHQFVGTYDGTNVLTYVDGTLVQSTTTANNGNGSPLFPMIGGDPFYQDSGNAYAAGNGGTGNTTYRQRNFSGSLAHFAFFTNVLSAASISNLYSIAVPNQSPALLLQPIGSPGNGAVPRLNPAPAFMYEAVVAYGTGPLSYQWYFNTVSNIVGATQLVDDGVKYYNSQGNQLVVSNLQTSDTGYYFCVVTNNYGAVTSHLGWVVINYAPVITAQNPAANFTLFPNQTFSLSVSTTADTNSFFYQWYTNGVGDGNGTSSSYPITATANNSGVTYQCIVTNIYGAATSAPVTLTVIPFPAALTNSPFSSNILTLNPTAYWPMHESGETPAVAEVETNYGSVGSAGLGYYDDWRTTISGALAGNLVSGGLKTNLFVLHNMPGAIAGDPNPAVELSGANRSYFVVPRLTDKDTIRPPFTLECWVKPNNNRGFWSMLAQDCGTLNTNNVRAGFDWLYSGTANTFSITIYNGTNTGSVEPKTTANYPPGYWYHLVTTYDGTNVAYYVNGVQDGLQNSPGATMGANTWDPITIGCCRGLGNNVMQGMLDEVAVYTNVLSVSDIQTHYNDGTNAAYHNYSGDVLADNPLFYYRMDSPAYAVPPITAWPVLTNYGAIGLNGEYTPGAVPAGGSGPSRDGLTAAGLAANNSLQGNGSSVFADAGFNSKMNPTGKTAFTVTAWVKSNPADSSRGWQSFMGRSDWGWRLNMDGNGGNPGQGNGFANFNLGNGTAGGGDIGNNGASVLVNDGQWHHVTGTFDGTNTVLYVDGVPTLSTSNTGINLTNTASTETFIGAYPNNNGLQPNSASYIVNEIGRVFSGSICEAAYWNGVALSSNQVASLYGSAGVAPLIEVQPISSFANENGSFTNKLLASGSGPLSYQWYKNGQPMPVGGQTNFTPGFGPTSSTLILNPISTNDQSLNYYVVVTNTYGSVTSAVWSLNPVFTVPVFTNDILNTNIVLYAGGHASFSIFAVGAQPITYRWYSNNVVVPGANGTSYTASQIQPAGITNIYYCVASNFVGMTTSSVAVVDIIGVPAVIPYSLAVMTDNPTGFWPLDETNGGNLTINAGVIAIADDYAGGNNGLYTNCLLGQAGFNSSDTNRTSVQFGSFTFTGSDVYNIPTNVDFGIATGSSQNFSVECWAKGFQQTVDAGIVTKGYGGGGEQFNLDCGSGSGASPRSFRFFFRDASGTVHAVNSTINPNDGLWHHLVGVCNETNGQVILYIDSLPVGTNSFSTGLGVLAGTRSMTIGARASNSTTNVNDLQFVGFIQDVSVYNYALSQQQVINHYFAADIPATIVGDAADENACQNGTALLNTTVLATPPVGYQWYDNNTGLPIAGATNSSLVVPNIQTSDSYYMVATNNYGTNQTRTASVTVYSGAPAVVTEPPASAFVPKGNTISIPVTVLGTLPMTNQWQMSDTNGLSWTNLADDVRISGSQQVWLNMTNSQPSILTIASAKVSDGGDYQLTTTNGSGSTPSSIDTITVGSLPIGFNGNGIGWTANQSGTYNNPPIADNVWEGTEAANGSEARSFFFQFPQYIGAFSASFSYQDIGGGGADGLCFCIQNDARGAAAIGGGGGNLGISGITPSWELEMNIYSGSANGLGYNIFTNGVVGSDIVPTQGTNTISFASGDPINISLFYIGGRMTLKFVDTVTTATVTTNFAANIPTAVNGQTAYIGFTAADGGVNSQQVVTNFQFASLASESLSVSNGTNAVISWNGLITGYTLQQNGNLSTTNWVDVPAADIVTNGLHKVTVPINSVTNLFYRLNSSD